MTRRPRYACAVVLDGRGRLLLELRPRRARRAAGHLTCFGGALEPGEAAEQALLRELDEELGWVPAVHPRATASLERGGELLALFFHFPGCWPEDARCREPGYAPLWVDAASWRSHPVSPWHAAVLRALEDAHGSLVAPAPGAPLAQARI